MPTILTLAVDDAETAPHFPWLADAPLGPG